MISDSQDSTFVWMADWDGNFFAEAVDSAGHLIWKTPTSTGTSPCCSAHPALGWNGSVFFSSWNFRDVFKVIGFDEATGAITFNHSFNYVTGLYTYADGVIIVNAGIVYYYDYGGNEVAEYTAAPEINPDLGTASSAGPDGAVYVAGYPNQVDPTPSVEKFTPKGRAWTWTETSPPTGQTGLFITTTPDGGTILSPANASDSFTGISPSGETRWLYPATRARGVSLWSLADTSGTVALMNYPEFPCDRGTCLAARIDFVRQETGADTLPPLEVTDFPNGDFYVPLLGLAIDTNRVYITRDPDWNSDVPHTLSAFDVAGLSRDFQLSLQPGPPPTSYSRYVALGDSYSAGEGNKPYFTDGYDPNTGTIPGNITNACDRSSTAYAEYVQPPGLSRPLYELASGGGNPGTGKKENKYGSEQNVRSKGALQWAFWACSGAKTTNVLPQSDGGVPQSKDDPKYREQFAQLDNPQINAATDLVTITIGGNDIGCSSGDAGVEMKTKPCGFAEVLKYCAKHSCYTPSYEAKLDAWIEAVGPRVEKVYADAREHAPNARVLAVGYPQVFPASHEEQACAKLLPWREPGEQDFLRAETVHLNAVLVKAAADAGVEYLNATNEFAGHEVCGNLGEWINGPTFPKGDAGISGIVGPGSFHPNRLGQRAYAGIVNDALTR